MLSGNGWNGRLAIAKGGRRHDALACICSMRICVHAHMRTIFTRMNREAGGRAELGKVALRTL
jgi:hypothetical protein